MEWFHYVLLALLPAIATFIGGICLKAAMVVKEHIEDMEMIKELMETLADKDNPLTPDEFKDRIEKLRVEFGETKEAWEEFIKEIKDLIRR